MRALWAGLILWMIASVGAFANPKDMQSVIDRQLEAFQADDFAKAMEFASPVLKNYFGTPENFQRMVTQGYPMVWRFDSMEFLENRIEEGMHWQRVMIRDLEGTIHVLDYRMTQTPEGWRINGVKILNADGFLA